MPRLIDAEHLKKRATDLFGDCWDNYAQTTEDFLEYIDNEPTVDAEPVVRCKDCKYANEYAMCGQVAWYNKEDDFCSRGERREDGTC